MNVVLGRFGGKPVPRKSLSLFNSHPLSLRFFSLSFAIAVFEWNFPFKKKRECRKTLHCADDKFLESLLIMKFCVSGAHKCLYAVLVSSSASSLCVSIPPSLPFFSLCLSRPASFRAPVGETGGGEGGR